jgi:O-methyltransferase
VTRREIDGEFLITPHLPFGAPELRIDDGESVLVHPTTGLAYRLNPSARLIWEAVQQPISVDDLRKRVTREFDVSVEQSRQTVDLFVDQLSELGLVDVAPPGAMALQRRYLRLLERILVNLIYPENELRLDRLEQKTTEWPESHTDRDRRLRDIRVAEPERFSELVRAKLDGKVYRGRPWRYSHTMVGLRRLEHLRWCAERVFADGVDGDFLEAGVCQGGAAIYMRALQVVYGEAHRLLWAADSYEGLPVTEHENDKNYDFSESVQPWLAASLETVQENFRTYDLLSDEVKFLRGWFHDTLPTAPIGPLAILRLDADLYVSTMEALSTLYRKVSPGGFVVIDDYYAFVPCRTAVTEFRDANGITEPIRRIDWSAVYWRKSDG